MREVEVRERLMPGEHGHGGGASRAERAEAREPRSRWDRGGRVEGTGRQHGQRKRGGTGELAGG